MFRRSAAQNTDSSCLSKPMTRRGALKTIACIACAPGLARAVGATVLRNPSDIPKSGVDDPAFAPFDTLIVGFMQERHIPGASLAVTQHGRLVYARGYGWSEVETQTAYQPTQLFRIASLSKSIASAAVLALVQAGKLNLDAPAFALLHLTPHREAGAAVDPRLATITVRQLLHHTGGFDRDLSGDPMFMPRRIATALGVASPPSATDIVRYTMGRTLDFDPGTRYAYSNFGYCVLGRIIETIAGKPYDAFATEAILQPAHITRMRLGKSRWPDRAPNEVRYYDGRDRKTPSIFAADAHASVPVQYGGWCIETMDSHGGWLASAVDLARFAATLDDPQSPILTRASRDTLYERPAPPVSIEASGKPAAAFYGMGWMVRPTNDGRANYWHSGKLDGSSSLLVRRHDGLTWILNFNTESVGNESLASLLDGPLHGAADAVRAWPTHDLFRDFGIHA